MTKRAGKKKIAKPDELELSRVRMSMDAEPEYASYVSNPGARVTPFPSHLTRTLKSPKGAGYRGERPLVNVTKTGQWKRITVAPLRRPLPLLLPQCLTAKANEKGTDKDWPKMFLPTAHHSPACNCRGCVLPP